MLVFMLFLGLVNNVLHATNETESQNTAQLFIGENTTVTINKNTITTENFSSQILNFSTNSSQPFYNTLYIYDGTIYFIDSVNNNPHQVVKINPQQNNRAKNTTKHKKSTARSKSSISKSNSKPNSNPFSTRPFRSPNDYYFTNSLISAIFPTQNHTKVNLQTSRFNSLLFPTAQLNATYYNKAINVTSAFCRYGFSLPPPSPLTPKGRKF